ncbi:MAG TPA: hypothetical protein P5096_03530 [Patescibacteria group bacterium]|nr:hypothetical protein [Patescibacteria group bacterium]
MKKIIKKSFALLSLASIAIPNLVFAVDQDNIAAPVANFIYCYIDKIFKFLAPLAGFGTVIMIIYGGFMYITSSGDPSKVKRGTSAITAAIVGAIITLLSFALVYFIGNKLAPGTFSWSYTPPVCE